MATIDISKLQQGRTFEVGDVPEFRAARRYLHPQILALPTAGFQAITPRNFVATLIPIPTAVSLVVSTRAAYTNLDPGAAFQFFIGSAAGPAINTIQVPIGPVGMLNVANQVNVAGQFASLSASVLNYDAAWSNTIGFVMNNAAAGNLTGGNIRNILIVTVTYRFLNVDTGLPEE